MIKKKVLLIVDHEDTLRSMTRLLEEFKFEVFQARKLSEAMNTFTMHEDLWAILVDGSVGAEDPHEFNTELLIRNFSRACRRLYIVAMASDESHRREQMLAGATHESVKSSVLKLLLELFGREQAGR